MTELNKKYRLTSMKEPTDEMLQELMEDMAKAARESSARAKAELRRRLSETARIIAKRRSKRILTNVDDIPEWAEMLLR